LILVREQVKFVLNATLFDETGEHEIRQISAKKMMQSEDSGDDEPLEDVANLMMEAMGKKNMSYDTFFIKYRF
jgi:hypothetical protein